MRALLVVNPFATSTDATTRDTISKILSEHVDLEIAQTTRSGHASELAYEAKTQGFDVVIGLGGDGTINEIANGILRDGPSETNPAVAAIPGGHANVFVRNLGIPADPIQATEHLASTFASGQPRTIGIGILSAHDNARWFLFNAGIGLDAAVLARMQERRATGKHAHDLAYAGIAVHEVLAHHLLGQPSLQICDQDDTPLGTSYFALIINLAPWTYLGDRPLDVATNANLDNALDVYAPKSLKPKAMGRLLLRIFGSTKTQTPEAIELTNQKFVSFETTHEMWVQVDGEALYTANKIAVTHVPHALRVWM